MWPQQPPGGEQNPQQPNPYQQPGSQQPNPYQQPSYGQQPPGQGQNPYQQPYGQQPGYGQQAGQQWGQSTLPGGPAGPSGGGKKSNTTVVAIVSAIAVVAAAVITTVLVVNDDDKKDTAGPDTKTSSSADPSPGESDGKKPGGGSASKDPADPLVPGWQSVINPKHYSAFDVPKNKDWELASQGTITGFEDDKSGKLLVAMSAPAFYKQDWCERSNRAAVGTKGAQGSRNTKEAAEIAASNFVLAGYDQKQKGTLKESGGKAFKNKQGIKGHIATASVTGAPKKDKCSADGKVVAISWLNVNDDLSIWIFLTDANVKDEVPAGTIKKMAASLRSYGEPGDEDNPRG
ncbi:hypothetical protein [Streptomyces albidus (ex Kaewkla and Franco 2022)]|uniref:hypothetical protein n=1 Tax=Streptomyces albidus (ex Kaewkla and Franco 2022) TaxID=722709 RepID=UPI0015EFCE49|nr:hypothetical protein [Streptomyces albidus (ex Kaewkla and Franco 2022)]